MYRRFIPLLARAGAALALSGCAAPPIGPPIAPLITPGTVEGQLNDLARKALPPEAQAVVELRDEGRNRVVAEQHQALQGRQVPIPFMLRVDPKRMDGPGPFSVSAALMADGQPLRMLQGVRVDLRQLPVDLGELRLAAAPPHLTYASTLSCVSHTLAFGIDGDQPTLQIATNRLPMQPVRTASGSRYVAPDDDDTWVWFKGDHATVMLQGEVLQECRVTASAKNAPATRLQGQAWTVKLIDGEPVQDDMPPTLSFEEDGHLTGHSSCNYYNARYTLAQSALEVSRVVSAMRSCAPALTAQEQRFFQMLQGAQRVMLQGEGSLTIEAGPGRTLRAQR